MFTNDYYKLLLDEKWNLRKVGGTVVGPRSGAYADV